MWDASLGSIPAGWELAGGTADLWIPAAGGAYGVGATGGVLSVDLAHDHGAGTFAAEISSTHNHTVHLEDGGGNHRTLFGGGAGSAGPVAGADPSGHSFTTGGGAGGSHLHTADTVGSADGTDHSHAMGGTSGTSVRTLPYATLGTFNTFPPSIALFFIVRVA